MTKKLRLYADSLYPGESLTSFLDRTSQIYRMPTKVLASELGYVRPKNGVKQDLDLDPPAQLLDFLAEVVPGWSGYDVSAGRFKAWVLTRENRTAYCLECFTEDLREGRTPYFRLDWAAAAVTSCWRHQVPLFNWDDITCLGTRRLPDPWLAKKRLVARPNWMEVQERLLGQAREPRKGSERKVAEMLVTFVGFQRAVEKPFFEPLGPERPDDVREFVDNVVAASIRLWSGLIRSGVPARVVNPHWAPWVEPHFEFANSVARVSTLPAVRRAGSLSWRRSYFYAAAQVLGGGKHDEEGAVAPDMWWTPKPFVPVQKAEAHQLARKRIPGCKDLVEAV